MISAGNTVPPFPSPVIPTKDSASSPHPHNHGFMTTVALELDVEPLNDIVCPLFKVNGTFEKNFAEFVNDKFALIFTSATFVTPVLGMSLRMAVLPSAVILWFIVVAEASLKIWRVVSSRTLIGVRNMPPPNTYFSSPTVDISICEFALIPKK